MELPKGGNALGSPPTLLPAPRDVKSISLLMGGVGRYGKNGKRKSLICKKKVKM